MSIVEGVAKNALACGAAEGGVKVSIHSEPLNSADLFRLSPSRMTGHKRSERSIATDAYKDQNNMVEWGPVTRRLLAKSRAHAADISIHKSLAEDLASFVSADAFIMTASALSNLAAFIRGGKLDEVTSSSLKGERAIAIGGYQQYNQERRFTKIDNLGNNSAGPRPGYSHVLTFSDIRNDHLPVVQYEGDYITRTLDPHYCTLWDGRRFHFHSNVSKIIPKQKKAEISGRGVGTGAEFCSEFFQPYALYQKKSMPFCLLGTSTRRGSR